MPRDLGQNNENRQPDDWNRIDTEFQQRARDQRKWDAEHDPGPEFERAARPLGPDYGADRPRYREIPPEVAAEFGRTPEQLQQLRERDPRGAGRHARLSSDGGALDHLPERGGRTSEAARHDSARHDSARLVEPGRAVRSDLGEVQSVDAPGRFEGPSRSGAHVRLGELPPSTAVRDVEGRRMDHSGARTGQDVRSGPERLWVDRTGGEHAWSARALGNLEQRGPDVPPIQAQPAQHLGTYRHHADSYHHEGGRRVRAELSGDPEHGGFGERAGLGERLGLDHTPFDVGRHSRSEAPRHLRDVPRVDEMARPLPDRGPDAGPDTDPDRGLASDRLQGRETGPDVGRERVEREYPPSWLTAADRPPPVEQTRTYNQVGHLTEPLPSEQRALEEVMPRDEEGNYERFADPRQDWTAEVNGVGPILEPGRGSNCLDCTLSAISTWHGEPRVSAPRNEEYDPNGEPVRTGERDGPSRAERWLGHDFEMIGADANAFDQIEQRMLDAGHGASAVIVNGWAPGGAHAWNAFNHQGKVYWVDTQLGDVSERPLYPQAVDVRAIMMDGEGNKA